MMRILTIILAVAVTAAVVYYGIEKLSPEPPETARLQAPPAPPSSATRTASADTGSAADSGHENPSATGLTAEQARHIAEQVGAAAATQVAASMSDDGHGSSDESGNGNARTGLTEDQVRHIARLEAEEVVSEEIGRLRASLATAHQTETQAAPAAEPTVKPPPAPAAPRSEPASRPPPRPKPQPKPRPAHANAARKTPPAHERPRTPSQPPAGKPASEAAGGTWWTKPGEVENGQFALVYAGEAAFGKAIVLLFNQNVGNPAEAARHLHVTDSQGNPVQGTWRSGDNRWMLKIPVPAGRYVVTVGGGLRDAAGNTLGHELSGPVVVH
jgi:hypothetical protein